MTELFHLMDNMKILILNINKLEGFPKWQLLGSRRGISSQAPPVEPLPP